MSRTSTAAVRKEAILSPCGRYRYLLTREWPPRLTPMTFIMLNPSTADAENDDPTIRRCMSFATRLEVSGIRVVNLFAWRATDKRELTRHEYEVSVGPGNDDHIRAAVRGPGIVVVAWGSHAGELGKRVAAREIQVRAICGQEQKPIFCLGVAKNGRPRHPLYLPANAQLKVWAGL